MTESKLLKLLVMKLILRSAIQYSSKAISSRCLISKNLLEINTRILRGKTTFSKETILALDLRAPLKIEKGTT